MSPALRPRRGARSQGRAGAARLRPAVLAALAAVLVGAALPIRCGLRARRARAATRAELALLIGAASQHFQDVRSLPASLADLERDPGVPGWRGPYVESARADAWSRPYVLSVRGDVVTVESAGPDGRHGNADDLGATADVAPLRRAETLLRLSTVNRAIARYNGEHQRTEPLPADWPRALALLVARGYLPRDGDFLLDAWGSPLREDPPGRMPVVRVASVHVPRDAGRTPR